MNDPPNRWNPEIRPETPPPDVAQAHIGIPSPNDRLGDPDLESNQERTEDHSKRSAPLSENEPLADLDALELDAIVGAESAFHGTLSFVGQVRIDGEFEGVARGGRLLVVGHGAHIVGRIEADQVIVLGGRVEADIVATRSIELHVPAEVVGELKSPQIYMDRGVQFQGTCDMTSAPPTVEPMPDDSAL